MRDIPKRVRALLAEGKSRHEIARALGISRQGVAYHQKKLGLMPQYRRAPSEPRPRFIRQWRQYNEALVRRGEALLDLSTLEQEQEELHQMNRDKAGRPYRYGQSLMQFLFVLKAAFKLDYRTLEGLARRLIVLLLGEHAVPDYTTIHDRFQKAPQELKVYYDGLLCIPSSPQEHELAIDSSGRCVGERGVYRENHYSIASRKFVKLHVAVNVQSGQVESLHVTGPLSGDSPHLRTLVEALPPDVKVSKAHADRAYDGEENYEFLQPRGIQPVIRPRTHNNPAKLQAAYQKTVQRLEALRAGAIKPRKRKHPPPTEARLLARKARYEEVMQCQKDYPAWREKNGYGLRALVECFFSRDTRILGDSVRSRKDPMIEKELVLRCSVLNLFASIARSMTGKARRAQDGPPGVVEAGHRGGLSAPAA